MAARLRPQLERLPPGAPVDDESLLFFKWRRSSTAATRASRHRARRGRAAGPLRPRGADGATSCRHAMALKALHPRQQRRRPRDARARRAAGFVLLGVDQISMEVEQPLDVLPLQAFARGMSLQVLRVLAAGRRGAAAAARLRRRLRPRPELRARSAVSAPVVKGMAAGRRRCDPVSRAVAHKRTRRVRAVCTTPSRRRNEDATAITSAARAHAERRREVHPSAKPSARARALHGAGEGRRRRPPACGALRATSPRDE